MAGPRVAATPVTRSALFVMAAGCAVVPPGHQSDADLCGGRGCASIAGTLIVAVLDAATGLPVAGTLTFSSPQYSGNVPFACTTATANPCPSWQLAGGNGGAGAYDFEVVAAGYRAGLFHAVIEGPTGCCGVGPDSSVTVTLAPP